MEKKEIRKTDQVLAASEKSIMDSELVATLLGISRSQASHILNSLCKHGHLRKHPVNVEAEGKGGRYYRYSITKWGKKRLVWLKKNDRL